MYEERFKKFNLLSSVSSHAATEHYTSSGTDRVNWQRAFNGETEYWVLPNTLVEKPKKKKIIISDASYRLGLNQEITIEDKHPTVAMCEFLMDQGFEIQVWDEFGRLITMKDKTYIRSLLNRLDFIPKDELAKKLEEKNIGTEDAVILDFTDVRGVLQEFSEELIDEYDVSGGKIKDFQLTLDYDEIRLLERDTLISFVSTIRNDPPLLLITRGRQNADEKSRNKDILNKFSDDQVDFVLKKRKFIALDVAQILAIFKALDKMKSWTIDFHDLKGLSVLPADYNETNILNLSGELKEPVPASHIERFGFHGNISINNLNQLLVGMPNLQSLDLDGTQFFDVSEINFYLPKLKKLTAVNSKVNNLILEKMLTDNQLEKLNLYNCKLNADFIKKADLSELRTISFPSFQMKLDEFLAKFTQSKKLKTMKFYDGTITRENDVTGIRGSFDSLETLAFESAVDVESMAEIIIRSPKLKKLSIATGYSITLLKNSIENRMGDKYVLPIANLALDHSLIKVKDFIQFLTRMNHLKELTLRNCEFNIMDLSELEGMLDKINLPDIKYLNLTGSRVTPELLAFFMKCFPNLEKINLNRCYQLGSDQFNFPVMEKIESIQLTLKTPAMIHSLLRAVPNVKNLHVLPLLLTTSGLLDTDAMNVDSLEKLTLDYPGRMDDFFSDVLVKNKQLKKLDIRRDDLDPFKIPEHDLENLQSLKIDPVDHANKRTLGHLDPVMLANLMNRTPNLQLLSVSMGGVALPALDKQFDSLLDLSVENVATTQKSLVEFLSCFPNVERLKISTHKLDPLLPPSYDFPELKSRFKASSKYAYENRNFFSNLRFLDVSGFQSPQVFMFLNSALAQAPNLVRVKISKDIKSNELIAILKSGYPNLIIEADANEFVPQGSRATESASAMPSSLPGRNREADLDSSTGPLNKKFTVRKYFEKKDKDDPEIEMYRLDVMHQMRFSKENVSHIPTPKTERRIIQIPHGSNQTNLTEIYRKEFHHLSDYFLGRLPVAMGTNDWIPLPSLSPDEKINLDLINCSFEYDLGYCEDESLYYIKPREPISDNQAFFSYLLHVPNLEIYEPDSSKYPQIDLLSTIYFDPSGNAKFSNEEHEKLFKSFPKNKQTTLLLAYFSDPHFKVEELNRKTNDKIETLNAIVKEHRGVCQHRTLAFCAVAKNLGIKARGVYNDCHAFVEVFDADSSRWKMNDLGGDMGELNELGIIPEKKVADEVSITNKENIQPKIANKTAIPKNNEDESNPFYTWNTLKSSSSSMSGYYQDLIKASEKLPSNKKNVLNIIPDDQVESFYTAMFEDAHRVGHQCYYIDSFKNVREKEVAIDIQSNEFIEYDTKIISMVKSAKPGDVILVNWNDYQAKDVGYNTMMDSKRKFKQLDIPEGVIVMGVINPSQKMGEDFYSRFRLIGESPRGASKLSVLPKPIMNLPQDSGQDFVLDFYDEDWKKYLRGSLKVVEGKYQFVKSNFINELTKNKKIIFRNAPWDSPDFRQFMTEMLIDRTMSVNGEVISIPDDLEIINLDKPYPFNIGKYSLRAFSYADKHENLFVVNTMTFNNLFERYEVGTAGVLAPLDGLLQMNEGRSIELLISTQLMDKDYAKILAYAEKYKVAINFQLAKGVTVPGGMKIYASSYDFHPSISSNIQSRLIISSDVDYTAEEFQDALIVPVNLHTAYSDLIEKINMTRQGKIPIFTQSLQDIVQQLELGSQVLLTGELSPQLALQLETLFSPEPYLWINGKKEYFPKANLTIIQKQFPVFNFVNKEKRIVNENDIWALLDNQFDKNDVAALKKSCDIFYSKTTLSHFSYVQLKSMLTRLQKRPHNNPLQAFMRLQPNYTELKSIAKKAWINSRLEKHIKPIKDPNVDVIQKRMTKFMGELEHSPYIFVAGASGIGKSNFIQTQLSDHGWKVLEGLKNLSDLYNLPPEQDAVLFIDEANLYAQGDFDVFEDLFGNPPGTRIDGVFKPLPPNKKILFAGNFGHFQGRVQHDFFVRHGRIITFKEFPDNFLREKILAPVLKELLPNLPSNTLATLQVVFLKVYHYLNRKYPDKHPLTVRNLQMMAMRFPSINEVIQDPIQAAYMSAFDEASGVLNKSQRKDLSAWLDKNSPANVKRLKSKLKEGAWLHTESFLMTKRRVNPVRVLEDLFNIRAVKKLHPSLKSTGTSGLLLEGEPGIGKSHLPIEFLHSKGYVNGNELSPELRRLHPKIYYHITPTDPEKMQKILHQAFHEGAVVVADEMNTMPLEHVYNAMMSGRDMEGKEADKPGFFVIGTQNPITYGKRQALSDATLNRFQKLDMKNYLPAELSQITTYLSNDPVNSEKLVDQLLSAQEIAKEKRKHHAPGPRNLFAHVAPEKNKTTPAERKAKVAAYTKQHEIELNQKMEKENQLIVKAKAIVEKHYDPTRDYAYSLLEPVPAQMRVKITIDEIAKELNVPIHEAQDLFESGKNLWIKTHSVDDIKNSTSQNIVESLKLQLSGLKGNIASTAVLGTMLELVSTPDLANEYIIQQCIKLKDQIFDKSTAASANSSLFSDNRPLEDFKSWLSQIYVPIAATKFHDKPAPKDPDELSSPPR